MGTSNFATLINADKYYTIGMSYEEKVKVCTECGHKHFEYEYDLEDLKECDHCSNKGLTEKEETHYPDQCEYEDTLSNIQEALKEKFPQDYTDYDDNDNDRNRPSKYFARILPSYREYGGAIVELEFRIMATTGYYEGANLDYSIVLNDEEVGDMNVAIEDILYETDFNEGMKAIQRKNIEKFINDTIEEVTKGIHEVFFEYSDNQLELVGRFSNGETIYKQV